MHIVEATYRIVTPMFLGDARQEATEVRPPSIKGALRYWWRALNWGRCLAQEGNDAKALKALHAREATLFGTAAGEKGMGQSRFILRVGHEGRARVQPPKASPGHAYLLGQGLYHFKNGYLRTAIEAGGLIRLRLAFGNRATDQDLEQVTEAIQLLGLLGGLGSRARKGFGSLALESLTVDGQSRKVPGDSTTLKQTLQHLLGKLPAGEPPFTAFSDRTRLDISATARDAWTLLDAVGQEMQLYRSWGRNGKVNGKPAERNFKLDHDQALKAVKGQCPDRLPKRIVMGLPHNYFFTSVQPSKEANLQIAPDSAGRTRRASPLLLHIHRFPDGQCLAVHTLLPAVFLPEGEQLKLEAKRLRRPCLLEAQVDWQVIHDYLDRFKDKWSVLEGTR